MKVQVTVYAGLQDSVEVIECDCFTVVNGQALLIGRHTGRQVEIGKDQLGQAVFGPEVDYWLALGPSAWRRVERLPEH